MNILCMGGRTVGPEVAWESGRDVPGGRIQPGRAAPAPAEQSSSTRGGDRSDSSSRNHQHGSRSTVHQHHPHAFHGCGAAGQVRTSRHAHGAGAAGLHDLESRDAVRSAGSDLAQSRPLRAVERPRIDAALVCASPYTHAGRECRIREAGTRLGHARRYPPFPPARQQGAGASRVSLGIGCRDHNRSAGAGRRDECRHGHRGEMAGESL